ncbi:hypothetical protein OIO90_006622 [Microbotryomycetes sp. JL221]|nr:hypothetical protein OIO90_006622 [Microbotryomycetes sp. JL221]
MDGAMGLPLAFGRSGKASAKPTQTNLHKSVAMAPNLKLEETVDDRKHAHDGELSKRISNEQLHGSLQRPVRIASDSQQDGDYDATTSGDAGDGTIDALSDSSHDLPVSHQAVMKDHAKAVACLALDPSGSRFVSGSYDYDCKLWDFGGMNSSFKPFRTWEPKENHQVHCVQFSPSGNSILVATGSNQAKLYDRDGVELAEFAKGDPYIRDLRNTDGHVAALTCVAWNPKNNNQFLTASEDGTLRIWDTNNKRKSKSTIAVKSKERGGRTKAAWMAQSICGLHQATLRDPMQFVCALAIRTQNVADFASRDVPTHRLLRMHMNADRSSPVWRSPPIAANLRAGEWTALSNASVASLGTDNYILTGTAGSHAGVLEGAADAEKLRETIPSFQSGGGQVVVIRRRDFTTQARIEISQASVINVFWHAKINQIITGSSDGSIHVLYSPADSVRGVTAAVARAPRVQRADFYASTSSQGPIIAPHSLPMFRDDDSSTRPVGGKRKREKERHDPQKTMKPMPPVSGPGRGGRIGAAATQHVVQGLVRNNMRDQDPREALLKYATASNDDNTWTAAWSKTQPKPVFDERADDDNKSEQQDQD